jgi:hypothetical protein
LSFEIIIQGLFLGLDPSTPVVVPINADQSVRACRTSRSSVWWGLVIAPKGLILMVGVYLAYKVRALNHNFNERLVLPLRPALFVRFLF